MAEACGGRGPGARPGLDEPREEGKERPVDSVRSVGGETIGSLAKGKARASETNSEDGSC